MTMAAYISDLITRVRGGFNSLRFGHDLQTAYEAENLEKLKLTVSVSLLLALVFYAIFAVLDYSFMGEKYLQVWAIRFAVVIPVICISFVLVRIINNYQIIEVVITINAVVCSLGIIWMMVLGSAHPNGVYWVGLMLVIVFLFILSGANFFLCLKTTFSILTAYVVSCLLWIDISPETFMASLLFLISSFIVGLTGSFFIDTYKHRDFVRTRLLDQKTKELTALTRKYQELSTIDELTGIPNRRMFETLSINYWDVMQRKHDPLSLLFLDVDEFKKYNDSYGHQQGDACLRQVADCIRNTLMRPQDIVTRYGGEEFAVLLPDTCLHGATVVAERIRKNVEDLGIVHEYSRHGVVTVSIGICTATPHTGFTLPVCIKKADAALYSAKQFGRNTSKHST